MPGIRSREHPARRSLKRPLRGRDRPSYLPTILGRVVAPTTTRLRLTVAPGAARARVVGRHGDGWKVRVAAAPERGRANDAVLALLADTLALPRASVALVSGAASRNKIVELTGLTPDEIERRLATAGMKESE
jgi:uncharacterized protein YggU (UPF0235/DUF167 family)